MDLHYAETLTVVLTLVPACLAAVFLLLLFGLVIAPAVFGSPERSERARKVLEALQPWIPLFAAVIRRKARAEPSSADQAQEQQQGTGS